MMSPRPQMKHLTTIISQRRNVRHQGVHLRNIRRMSNTAFIRAASTLCAQSHLIRIYSFTAFRKNLPDRRGGRSAPRQHDAHSDEVDLNLVTIVFDDVAQSAMQIDVDFLISDVQESNTYEQAIAPNHHKEWTELMSNSTLHEPIDHSSIPPGRKLCEHISSMGWDLKTIPLIHACFANTIPKQAT